MINKIEELVANLRWTIKDREANYIDAKDIKAVVCKLEDIIKNERNENCELS
jgi:hypothetical protein